MASFVLVHGAWGGATLWRGFAPLLREKGHEVFYTSLTGLGERYHLGTPQTTLSTHVQDVVELVEYENLQAITLVGHSYGGMVITGVAGRIPERIAHIVYLDAFLPRDGESLFDITGQANQRGAIPMEVEDGFRAVPRMPPGVEPPPGMVLRGQPVGTFEEKVRLPKPLEEMPFTRTYVKAGLGMMPGMPPGPRDDMFWRAAERVRNDPRWRYVELPASHGLYTELPMTVAGLLLDIVNPPPPPPWRPQAQGT